MAVVTRGQTFSSTETITNTKLHNLVDLATVTSIVDADIDPNAAIQFSKLLASSIDGSLLTNLANIVSGAGKIPFANLPTPFGSTYVSLVSIPNLALQPLTLASWVDGAAMRNIGSLPSLAGQFPWYSVVSSLASGAAPVFNGVDKLVGGSSVPVFTAGDYYVNGVNNVATTTSGTAAKVLEIFVPRSGALRIKFFIANGTNTANAQIYRNGSTVGTLRSGTGNYSEDISGWSVGDLCQVYLFATNAGNSVYAAGLQLFEGNPVTTEYNFITYPTSFTYTGAFAPTFTGSGTLGSIGDLFVNTGGGANTTLYVKTGASTWTAK